LDMSNQPDQFPAPVENILAKYSDRRLPLNRNSATCSREDARELLALDAAELFPRGRQPEAALTGLLLLMNCWDASHEVAQNISSVEGSYWHGIAHRIEPDSANASYWFRRVGSHAIFADLRNGAAEILERYGESSWRLKERWDPFLFIAMCDEARNLPGSKEEQIAMDIQKLEWELLFAWCAKPAISGAN
jgi:hypothetical protein